MKKFKEFLNPKLAHDKKDHIMKQLMKEKFDTDLKNRYSEILEKEYKLAKPAQSEGRKSGSKMKQIVIPICIIICALLAYLAYNNFKSSKQDDVQQYFAAHDVSYQETMRSSDNQSSQILTEAYKAFNDKDFSTAVSKFQELPQLGTEESYYNAYAQMRLGNFAAAKPKWAKLSSQLNDGDKYHQETQFYYGLCLYASEDSNLNGYLNTLEKNSWAYKELKKVIKH